jgi:hypothetical protein
VTYKSNNPLVATIDESGKVTATGVGAALIFVDVTVNGKTVSNSCPVKVMPDLTPKLITIDGKNIEGFNKDVKAYSYLLKNNAKAPVIKASAMVKDVTVDIEQAKTVPGTTVVKYLDNITQEKNIYYFNFDVQSVSDEFNTPSLGKPWEWVRENKSTYTLSKKPGSMTITSEKGDISENSNIAKNLLLQSANNDWTIDTKLTCSRIPSQPENAGILVYENDDNFVKLMLRAVTKTTRSGRGGEEQPGTLDFIIEENGIAKSMASFNLRKPITGSNSLILRLDKKGGIYTAYYSLDGEKFDKLGTASISLKDIKAGLMTCDGIIIQGMKSTFYFNPDTTKPSTPFDVSFDYFHIINK